MGRWECDGKPEEAHFGIVDDALERIAQNTSPVAFNTTGPYDPRRQQNAPQRGGGIPQRGFQPQRSLQPQAAMRREADFDDIQDDYSYNLAQELYGQEADATIEEGRFAYMLYGGELAIMRVEARKSTDIVTIETFRSERGLYDTWADIETGAR
jgi:hypothetical protein